MSDTKTETRLWTAEGFLPDDWRHADSADALAGEGRFILPLEAFLSLDGAALEAHAHRIGVKLMPGEALAQILSYLDTLPLVALAFPVFNDGRSYSKASLLRERHGYRGEIRAVGDVLIDQVPHMLRCGFSALEVADPVTIARLEEGRIGGIGLYYQPAAKATADGGRYSWRHIPA